MPKTLARAAPVARGTLPGRPITVSRANNANAIASFAAA
jgi:hypothetical protein